MQIFSCFHPLLRRCFTGRRGAGFLLFLLAVVMMLDTMSWRNHVKAVVFDLYHQLSPRQRISQPVTIVAIDEQSLAALGQWPWPRTLLARLVSAIMAAKPAVLGIDLIFPEPDRFSPDKIDRLVSRIPAEMMDSLKQLPSNDEVFAAALAGKPVVLGFAGTETRDHALAGGYTPFIVRGEQKGVPSTVLRRFAGTLHSIDTLDRVAAGRGLLSADLEKGVVRRIPMAAVVDGTLVPGFDLELLRVVTGAATVVLETGKSGAVAIGVGDLRLPVEPDGRLWVHFSPHDPDRFVSAKDLLDGRIPAERFENRFVLLAVTGIGMVDFPTSPLGEYIPGVEVHAQLLESVFDNTLLARPKYARYLETAVLLLLGIIFIARTPGLRPTPAIASGVLMLLIPFPIGFVFYKVNGLLFDFITPTAASSLVLAMLLWDGFKRTEVEKRQLAWQFAIEKEQATRMAAELEAARRIQMALLPDTASTLREVPFLDIFAHMKPAQEVGGDLYDFFLLPDKRLFFVVGDVSGKGLPASLFMAISKVLCKSIVRQHAGSLGEMLTMTNRQLTEENREFLFLTVFVGILDLHSGYLEYSNAGHDFPYIIDGNKKKIRRLEGSGGPPLCVVEGFSYEVFSDRLQPAESLVIYTDGIPEAGDAAGRLFGHERLQAEIERDAGENSAAVLGEAILKGVTDFIGGAPIADDITLLVLRLGEHPGGNGDCIRTI